MPKSSLSPYDRFLNKIDKNGPIVPGMSTPCWIWCGGKNKDGYGITYLQGKTMGSHRASWILANGDIPAGLLACHKCDNPGCVNPAHLFLGTQVDNLRDARLKDRIPRRDLNLEERIKLASETTREILKMATVDHIKQSVIAKTFGLSRQRVSKILADYKQ